MVDPGAGAGHSAPSSSPAPAATGRGFGRILVAVYGIFALAATSRSAVQLTTRFDDAPVAYLLSAFAAIVYVVATISLARAGEISRRLATVAISIELFGVLVVGAASVLSPEVLPQSTVWTGFGSGYGFVPLLLPFVGLWWLRHTR